MSRVDKSPEQLDAEASQPLEERDLGQAIALHRALYHADLNWLQKIHVRDGESGIGPPFSPVFEAYLDGRLGQFPWSKALYSLRNTCRTTHKGHVEPKEWRGSLCAALVVSVIRLDYSLDMTRLQLGLPNASKTQRTLDNALLFIERRMEDAYYAATSRQPLERSPREWMGAAHVHQRLAGLHAVDCPQCAKAA